MGAHSLSSLKDDVGAGTLRRRGIADVLRVISPQTSSKWTARAIVEIRLTLSRSLRGRYSTPTGLDPGQSHPNYAAELEGSQGENGRTLPQLVGGGRRLVAYKTRSTNFRSDSLAGAECDVNSAFEKKAPEWDETLDQMKLSTLSCAFNIHYRIAYFIAACLSSTVVLFSLVLGPADQYFGASNCARLARSAFRTHCAPGAWYRLRPRTCSIRSFLSTDSLT